MTIKEYMLENSIDNDKKIIIHQGANVDNMVLFYGPYSYYEKKHLSSAENMQLKKAYEKEHYVSFEVSYKSYNRAKNEGNGNRQKKFY